MLRNLDNCFYCQRLENPLKGGKCAFCGVYNSPLYLIIYENKEKFFCYGCAWWQSPHSKKELETEKGWYQQWKKLRENELGKRYLDRPNKHFNCSNCEDMGYTVIRSGGEIVEAIDCDCEHLKKYRSLRSN